MKNNFGKIIFPLATALLLIACDKETKDLVKPITSEAFPQVIKLSDEGDGGLEDEDKFSFKITLAKRSDKSEPAGKIIPLSQAITVQFKITEFEGFSTLSDYIHGAEAFYEIDDCTTSLDEGINLNLQFDAATGEGSVTFPPGVEEIEVVFETDDSFFDDGDFNTDKRNITIQLTGMSGDAGVVVNKTASFTYEVQDDEGIYGEWELDASDPVAFEKFKQLFGLVNEDIKELDAADVSKITVEFEYGEVKAIVELNETEDVEECGSTETVNKVIEIEAEIEDLSDGDLEGDVEFGETLELSNGTFADFAYKGSFAISGSDLSITLQGEFDDDTTDELTLELKK